MSTVNGEQLREPQYLDEVSELVGPLFSNRAQQNALEYEGIRSVSPEDIDARIGVYVGALRIIAEQRRLERQAATQGEVAQTNAQFESSLSQRKLDSLKLTKGDVLDTLAEKLARANGGRPPCDDVEDIMSGLWDHQKPYMRRIASFLMSSKTHPIVLPEGRGNSMKYMVKGAVVEAGTGTGKSAIMGRTLMVAGIGKPMPTRARNHRALIVTPSKLINDQLAGIVGDDTLRRFAPPGIKVISYSGEDKKDPDVTADVVVTTIEQFAKATKDGRFYDQEFDLLLVDEAHQITEPQFQKTYIKEWRASGWRSPVTPIPAIGFTAKTAYSEYKDAAAILPEVIRHRSLTHYMQKDILSAGQFFTLIADPSCRLEDDVVIQSDVKGENVAEVRNEAVLSVAYDMATSLVNQGRRGIIFCESGNKSEQARQLAKLISAAPSTGPPIRAEALYVWDPKTSKRTRHLIDAFNNGEIDVLTTVGVGQQGLNADFNFVGICGPVGSAQKMTQEIGRGMRKSEDFPVTIFFHILHAQEGKPSSTITFGDVLDQPLLQGEVLGPKPASGKSSCLRQDKAAAARFNETALPGKVRLLLNKVTTHSSQQIEYVLNGKMEIPGDYVPFDVIYAGVKNVDATSAKRRLDAAGYVWRGRLEESDERVRFLRRYYEPAAASFFSDKPIPARATSEMLTASATAARFGISEPYLEKLRRQMEAETELRRVYRLNKRNSASMHYDTDALEWLEAEVAKIVWRAEGDESRLQIAQELEVDETVVDRLMNELDIKGEHKRRTDVGEIAYFLSKQDAKRIKKHHRNTPWATDEWSIVRIAEQSGIVTKNVHTHFTDDDRAALCNRRTRIKSGNVRDLEHLPEQHAKAVVARIKERQSGVRAHLIPYQNVVRATNAPQKRVPAFVQSETIYFGGNNYPQRVIGWEALRQIVEKYGWRNGDQDITFDNLPQTADDTDVERNVRARALQLRLMTLQEMGYPDGIID